MVWIRCFIAVMLAVSGGTAGAQQPIVEQPLEYYDSYLWSGGINVTIDGTRAYVAMVNGLMVLDISNPSDPEIITRVYLPTGYATDVKVQDDRAYVTALEGGFYVVDLQSFEVVGEFATKRATKGVDIAGDIAYVGYGLQNDDRGLLILDVSDPGNIDSISHLTTEIVPFKVMVRAGVVYIAGFNSIPGGQVVIADVNDPEHSLIVSKYSTGYLTLDLDLKDSLLFLADGSVYQPASFSSFTIVNVADTETPAFISRIEYYGTVSDVNVSGNTAVIAHDSLVRTIDISDPANPTEVGRYRTCVAYGAYTGKVAVQASTVFAVSHGQDRGPDSFQLLDISAVDEPVLMGELVLPERVNAVVCQDGYAYALGKTITSISLSTSQQSIYQAAGEVRGAAVEGGLLLAAGTDGLELVDVTDPLNMQQLKLYSFPGFDVKLRSGYAFLAGETGVHIFDISGGSGMPVRSLPTGDVPLDLALHGDYMYVADGFASGRVYNVSDPQQPTLVKTFGNSTYNGVEVSGVSLYMKISNGFHLFDISDPQDPVRIGTYIGTPVVRDILVVGDYVVLAEDMYGVNVVDVSDPTDPQLFHSAETSGSAFGVFATDDYLFVADKTSVIVFSNGIATSAGEEPAVIPKSFELHQNYPNPFNPRTTIRFSLEKPSRVCLSVFNVLGQEVAVLAKGKMPLGTHEVCWKASQVPSGLYFYRLETEYGTISRRMVHLK